MRHLILILPLLFSFVSKAQEPRLTRAADGRLSQSQHDIYDSHDRIAVSVIYEYDDSTGAVTTRTLRGYDRQGRVQRIEIYSADERLLFTETYHYRRNGHLRKRVQCTYDDDGVLIDKSIIKP